MAGGDGRPRRGLGDLHLKFEMGAISIFFRTRIVDRLPTETHFMATDKRPTARSSLIYGATTLVNKSLKNSKTCSSDNLKKLKIQLPIKKPMPGKYPFNPH